MRAKVTVRVRSHKGTMVCRSQQAPNRQILLRTGDCFSGQADPRSCVRSIPRWWVDNFGRPGTIVLYVRIVKRGILVCSGRGAIGWLVLTTVLTVIYL